MKHYKLSQNFWQKTFVVIYHLTSQSISWRLSMMLIFSLAIIYLFYCLVVLFWSQL